MLMTFTDPQNDPPAGKCPVAQMSVAEMSCNPKVSTIPYYLLLHFLKLLKHVSLSADDSRYFYNAIVRPVLKYACVVWNHHFPTSLSDKLESIQKRALRIINGDVSFGMPYSSLLYLSDSESLSNHRLKLSKTFLWQNMLWSQLLCMTSYHQNVP